MDENVEIRARATETERTVTRGSSGSGTSVAVELHGAGLSPEEVLNQLRNLDIETYVTEQGDLAVKAWQVAVRGFVSPEQARFFRDPSTRAKGQDALNWVSANLEGLKREYRGMWIAVKDDRVAAAAHTLPDLLEEVKERRIDDPFVTFIPTQEIPRFYAFHA